MNVRQARFRPKVANKDELRSIADLTNKDSDRLASLASDGMSDQELADYFEVPVSTLEQFSQLLAKARAEHALRIRRALLAAAIKGDPTVLAYLAAKYLDGGTK